MEIVAVENLVKRYKELLALDHFNMQIEKGEVFALLGPNGCGKTTAINCILQLLTFDKGVIRLFGEDMSPSRYDIKRRIGIVPQNIAVFEELSVRDNIDYFCALYVRDRHTRKRLVDEAIEFVGLEDYTKFRPRKLSGGLIRRLNIACGIAHKPELIFFDEPTVAVDPQSRYSILEGIKSFSWGGATIVYTSHYMEEVEEIGTRIMIMDHGQTLACGTNNELKAMISTGEKIQVEVADLPIDVLSSIKKMPFVQRAIYEGNELDVSCTTGKNNLGHILELLQKHDRSFGRVYSEPPTLNDVFLELTGSELRD
ncbi:MAG TPA: ABC transporter ATP-binding protein [Coriobacteriia bacterium]|nr:ABC transporter ATP-binding protein [Coriobacteriia bacterium]